MAKVKQFEKVLEVLKAEAPNAVSKEMLAEKLGGDVVMYRISTYIWEVKNKAGGPIETVKDGRKVVGFKIADATVVPAPVSEETVAAEVEVADAASA